MLRIISRFKVKLSEKQKKFVRKVLKGALSFPCSYDLQTLALKHGTDKWGQGYMKYYERYFEPIKTKKLTVLEIGVGGYEDPKEGGASLRMWQEYFTKSMIYAIDVHDKSCHEDKRIRIFKGSQDDPSFLRKIASKIEPIDIIIDDGSHVNKHVITSFHTLYHYLSAGGIYVIEDVQTSYWPKYGGNSDNLNDPSTTMSMLKDLVDSLNHEYILSETPTVRYNNVFSVHFYRNSVFVFKGKEK